VFDAGVLRLKANPRYCIDVQNNDQRRRTVVQLWEYNGTSAQKWKYDGGRLVLASNPSLCLDVRDARFESWTQVQIENRGMDSAQRWLLEAVDHWPLVRISDKIAEGCQRICFRGTIQKVGRAPTGLPQSPGQAVVAKVGKSPTLNLKHDADDLVLARQWAQRFTSRFKHQGVPALEYVRTGLGVHPNHGLVQLEEKLPAANFEKFNEAMPWAMNDSFTRWTPNFFSHWVYEESGHNLLITDVQGVRVGDTYSCTDPFIHRDKKVMKEWMRKSKCNGYCKKFGLKCCT